MRHPINIKQQLLEAIQQTLLNKIEELQQSIIAAKESRDNDTKSSAGDKYETGRAMMDIEIAKNETQINNIKKLLNQLSQINPQNQATEIGFGSVVSTNQGNYFVAIATGNIFVEDVPFYTISLASPLKGKSKGDSFTFQQKEYEIEELL